MAELFKNIYSQDFFSQFLQAVDQVNPEFNQSDFLAFIFDESWKEKELKQRMRHITLGLGNFLNGDFPTQVRTLLSLIPVLKQQGIKSDGIAFIFFPDFIEVYGLNDFQTSVEAMEVITQFVSCEFAVRPFIIKYPEAMMKQMVKWSQHEHYNVRRLATEGARPRLPWGMALPSFKKDPSPVLPILEQLKDDESETVRRSVANNLNDISKDNPELVIQLAKQWKGNSAEVDWVVKHACRGLLKQGIPEVMQLFGFGGVEAITIDKFQILTPIVKIGDYLEFCFALKNNNEVSTKIRLEYGLYYQKANGSLARKVFKVSEKEYEPSSIHQIHRRQSFKLITTRKFHKGLHQLSIIINGVELDKLNFQLE